MKKLVTHIGIAILVLLSWMPMWLAYRLSDLLFYLIYYLVGYRRKVVTGNLRHAFPEKPANEINEIRRAFYRHLCDLTIEGIMLKSLSAEQLKKRMKVTNPELVDRFYDEGKSVLVLTMHYNNWEWNSILQHYLQHRVLLVYNPARNLTFDKYMNQSREQFGSELVSTKKIMRKLLQYKRLNKPTFTWLSADQRPKWNTKFWTVFLNREAGFFPGPESLARHTNHAVLYQHTRKVKRGFYETTFSVLAENPAELPENEVLKRYVAQIEKDICRQPEYYLWSHKRWKHKRPAHVPLQQPIYSPNNAR